MFRHCVSSSGRVVDKVRVSLRNWFVVSIRVSFRDRVRYKGKVRFTVRARVRVRIKV